MMAKIDIKKKEFFEANSKRFAVQERLKRGCSQCGTKGQRYLQFHHREPKDKLFEISWGLDRSSVTRKMLDLELEKCDVLCVVCHKRVHAGGNLKGAHRSSERRMKKIDRLRNQLRDSEDSEKDFFEKEDMMNFWELE